jgi:hypothetical protein
MGTALKDFIAGGVIVVAGIIVGVIMLVVLFILGLFLHILAVLLSGLLFIGVLLFFVWTVGFVYRKVREKSTR